MQNNENVTEVTKPTTEHIAMEILKHEQDKSKAKNVGVISLTIAVIIIAIGMAVINYRNDCDWRELFGSYDYVSQDGEGTNYYNSEIGGNVNNGATNQETERQK